MFSFVSLENEVCVRRGWDSAGEESKNKGSQKGCGLSKEDLDASHLDRVLHIFLQNYFI